MTTRTDIERVLWKACDSFRGKIDSSRYKDYILSMLFVKYLSDVTKEKRENYMVQYNGDERRVERAMSRERFRLIKNLPLISFTVSVITMKSVRRLT